MRAVAEESQPLRRCDSLNIEAGGARRLHLHRGDGSHALASARATSCVLF